MRSFRLANLAGRGYGYRPYGRSISTLHQQSARHGRNAQDFQRLIAKVIKLLSYLQLVYHQTDTQRQSLYEDNRTCWKVSSFLTIILVDKYSPGPAY